jgi:26S proteasome regulatory subunit N1
LFCAGASLAGILAVLFSCLDMKSTLAGKQHYLLYTLVAALRPRMLMTGARAPAGCTLRRVPRRW